MNKPDPRLDFLIRDLPSPESARRFFQQFSEKNPSHAARLQKNEGLFSDVLALASYSPLLAATLIQNPDYVSWLGGKRSESAVQDKDELLESLARFSLTNSQVEPHVLLARFRRRELLRIFLRDIRQLGTVAEITEEISNLADAILEHAFRLARQEMDNRFGPPFEVDGKGREMPSTACVVSLGKLGSKELNYSSDIDLLFIYSAEGSTKGTGSKTLVTNREYFVKFAGAVTQLVGRQTGEGAAYRVDLRLRPHGRVGALALSLKETVRYYLNEGRNWEQQVLIRSRPSAGDAALYREFFSRVEETVFRKGRNANDALREVYLSKERIDQHHRPDAGVDVKLGHGGIREIEFIAQALQLAHGGRDRWLRVPHTLISLARLADRGFITGDERSALFKAYGFLRRLEHLLQMEHGLQTHTVPAEPSKRVELAARMKLGSIGEFEAAIREQMSAVHRTFLRVFGQDAEATLAFEESANRRSRAVRADRRESAGPQIGDLPAELQIMESLERMPSPVRLDAERREVLRNIAESSPKFAQMIAARPWLVEHLRRPSSGDALPDYDGEFGLIESGGDAAAILAAMRQTWSRLILAIAVGDVYRTLEPAECRRRQTMLAEAAISTAVRFAASDLAPPEILALGKLGSGTLDYDSDLDLMIVYRDGSAGEAYSRLAERFVMLLSSLTRDGNLYRVDLRLRPYGKNGPNVTTLAALAEYIETRASIWELLAYVQLRSVPIEPEGLADETEATLRDAIGRRRQVESVDDITREAREMRLRLERTHGGGRSREIDIKFGSGGLLDVYFVARTLHLIDPGAVASNVRATSAKLDAFRDAGKLSGEDHAALREGHAFMSLLDHNIRLVAGRSSRVPSSSTVLGRIAARMGLASAEELGELLTMHRLQVRDSFEKILGT